MKLVSDNKVHQLIAQTCVLYVNMFFCIVSYDNGTFKKKTWFIALVHIFFYIICRYLNFHGFVVRYHNFVRGFIFFNHPQRSTFALLDSFNQPFSYAFRAKSTFTIPVPRSTTLTYACATKLTVLNSRSFSSGNKKPSGRSDNGVLTNPGQIVMTRT